MLHTRVFWFWFQEDKLVDALYRKVWMAVAHTVQESISQASISAEFDWTIGQLDNWTKCLSAMTDTNLSDSYVF
jgi:hypothetical protein